MFILDILKISLGSLASSKLRSILTVLGIVIGVTAVISLMSLGKGAEVTITESIEQIGTNLLFVRPGSSIDSMVRGAPGSAATLTLEDAEALEDPFLAPAIAKVAPQVQTGGQVVVGSANTFAQILGITPEYQELRNFEVAEGEFISDREVAGRSSVAVLGASVAETLFPDISPLGKTVRINQKPFRVVGVLQSRGGTALGMEDNTVLLPITTVQSRLARQRTVQGRQNIQLINVQAVDARSIESAREQITEMLRERHRITYGVEDDFTVTSQEEIIQARTDVVNVFTIFLGAIAGIALLVGGIGIMNIMLVSVAERTREIGIRKAVGARQRDIMFQFLMEATILSLGGGALGVAMGWGIAQLISGITLGDQALKTAVTLDIVLLAVSVSVFIGLFFGIYPASRAARLDPIEALRHE